MPDPASGVPGPQGEKGDPGPPGPAGPPGKDASGDGAGIDWRTLSIVCLGLVAIVIVTVVLVYHYPVGRSKAVQAILGIALTAITTLTGTAFGISSGAKAGAAAGTATAKEAQTAAARTRDTAKAAADQVSTIRRHHTPAIKAAVAGQDAASGHATDLESTLLEIEATLRAAAAG